MSGHTPGDWIYGVRRDGSMWLSIGDRRHGPHYQGDLVATEEDARLICAAPKLLDFAKAYVKWVEIGSKDDKYFYAMAKAAIAETEEPK